MFRVIYSLLFKVIGPMICVQATVHDTLGDILPLIQELIPVALKRKLEYKGSYIFEVISRSKLEFYFTYFKDNNHLFSGANFESEQLDKFITDTLESIEAQDDAKVQRKEDAINNSIHMMIKLSCKVNMKMIQNLPS